MKWLGAWLIFLGLWVGCSSEHSSHEHEVNHEDGHEHHGHEHEIELSSDYTFYVAGHVYGDPTNVTLGLFPSFLPYIDTINEKGDYMFFTGDMVYQSDSIHWNPVLADLKKLALPIHIAPGNHDKGPVFTELFGRYFYAFNHLNDLMIILTPDQWNIVGPQYDFLKGVLESNLGQANRIFVFCHELIWFDPMKTADTRINFPDHYPGETNFSTEVLPLFAEYAGEVYFFAGDLGATEGVSGISYHQLGNVHLIASGMGGSEESNFLEVDVHTEGVDIQVCFLDQRKESIETYKKMLD